MLILKENAANSVPTPPSGKDTFFIDDSGTPSVKNAAGNVSTFPTTLASNAQVLFMNGTALTGDSDLTYNFNTNVLTVTGNVSAGNVLTNNLLYANGTPWDLTQPAGSNTQIQFNDGAGGFGASANLVFNSSTNVLTVTGNVSAGNVTATDVTGTTLGGTLTTTAQPNITSVGTLSSLAVNGNTTSGNVYANGGTVGATLLTGTLTTAAQPNVTSVGTLSSLAVTANVTAGNVYANSGTVGASVLTGTLSTAAQPNVTSVGTLSSLAVSGNVTAGNVYANSGTIGANLVAGTLTTAAQPNVTSVGTLTGLGVNGNITGANITANTGVFTGNGSGLTALAGANVTGQVGNALVSGTVYTAAQPNITSVGTLSGLTVDGSNVTLANGVYVGNAAGLTNIPGGNIVGNITGNISNANFAAFAAEVTDASQPNITSVGTLSSLTVSGNASAGNVNTAGKVVASSLESNVSTGTAPFVVASTTKVANLNADLLDGYSTATAATANTVVIRDADGSFSANIITATLSGAATTAGTVTTAAQPNITSVGTLSSLAVTGNISGGNLNTAGKVVASTFESNVADGTAPFVVVSTTKVANLNADLLDGYSTATAATANTVVIRDANGSFSANVITASLSGAATTAGTVTTAAQPNITSVGTLTSLGVNGTVTAVAFTANTGVFTGNGSGLSAIAGANVTGQVANALVAGTVYTAAQPNITSVGTLSSLAVTGNATAGNVYANSGTIGASLLTGTLTTAAQPNITSTGTLTSLTVTGNASAGNISTGGVLSVTGNANVGNIGAAAGVFTTVAGSLTTAAQPNVTSLGTLTSLAVTGNATAGNVYANSGTIGASLLTGTLTTAAQPNITSVGTLSSLSVTANVAAGNLTTTGVLSVTGTGVSSIAGNLDMTSNNIINLATPVNASDAATKQYVDDVAQGLNIHDSCQAATPDTLANITSGTITYNNGSSGVGATLVTTGTFNLIDGVNVQTAGTRILVKNEANAVFNGIYTYTNTTAITRATDFNSIPEVEAGDFTFVTGGTLYDNTGWVQTDSPAAIGTAGNTISFTQFSGAGTYQAGTGLTLTGSTFSVNVAQPTITSVGTLTGLGVNGTITGVDITANTGVFTGNGSGLTALNASNISSGTLAQARLANASVTLGSTALTLGSTVTTVAGLSSVTSTTFVGALTGAATTAGTVTTAAQPNITSTGTLTSLGVSGAVTASTLVSNVTTGTAPLTVTSTTRVANLNVAYANVADFVNVADVTTGTYYPILANAATGNVSEGSNSALTFAAGTGTLSATVFSGSGASLTSLNGSNISSGTIAQARLANSSLTVNGTSISLGGSGTITANTTQTLTLGSFLTGTSFNGGTAVTAAVDATSANTASKVVARDASGNFSAGTITATLSGAATTAGTVTTAAQPNITSVGTLTSLTVSGNITQTSGYEILTTSAAVSAAGTAQGNATAITTQVNVTSTVASGAGVALPTAQAGLRITIINTAANAVLVYPASGGTINALALNAAYSLGAGGRLDFQAVSSTQWYTLNATYA